MPTFDLSRDDRQRMLSLSDMEDNYQHLPPSFADAFLQCVNRRKEAILARAAMMASLPRLPGSIDADPVMECIDDE